MLGSNSLTKGQKRGRNSNNKTQITRTRKSKKIKTNSYNVYDIEQTATKTRKRSIKSAKSNETINNIDIIEDIDKVPSSRIDSNKETSESSSKTILPPLSPVSISSENPDSVVEVSDSVSTSKKDVITIIINDKDVIPSINLNEDDDDDSDDDDVVEIIKEKIVKYSQEPTVFQSFTKNKVLWCHYCGTTNTSSWRHGPWGKKSLCNKHGCDYKGYGFTVRQPRLDLSKFLRETTKRIRPVIQEYCCICFSNDSTKDNVLVMCDGCYRAYHQNCYPDKISSDIVKSSEPFYCREECKKTRELKKIETELPRKNLPFMFNRGLTNKNQKSAKSLKSTQKSKDLEGKENVLVSAPSSPVLSSKSSSVVGTPSTTAPSTPSQSKVDVFEMIEPEPKVLKSNLLSGILKERHARKKSAKKDDANSEKVDTNPEKVETSPTNVDVSPKKVDASPKKADASPKKVDASPKKEDKNTKKDDKSARKEDTIVHYTKKHTPIIGFRHDNIPTPDWEYHETIEISSPSKKRKRGKQNKDEEMLEDISDEAYIKRHYPLELSEKYSRCGSLINTSNIDEEAINKLIAKFNKKGKLRKGYIYI